MLDLKEFMFDLRHAMSYYDFTSILMGQTISFLQQLTYRDIAFAIFVSLIIIIASFPIIGVNISFLFNFIVDLMKLVRDAVRLLISSIRAIFVLTLLVGVPFVAVQMMRVVEEESGKFGSGGRGGIRIAGLNKTAEQELIAKLKSGLKW